MSEDTFTQYGKYLFDIKTYEINGSSEWTTHFDILRDELDRLVQVSRSELGNRSSTEKEARLAGLVEAKRIADGL